MSSATSTRQSPLSASRPIPSLSSALKGYVHSAPAYDGTSSDLALQYLSRYAAGDVVDVLNLTPSKLPSVIQERLTSFGLKFEELDGFLQRALLWDSGYVISSANPTELVKNYTNYDRTMSEIALPVKEMTSLCTIKTCPDANGVSSNRSEYCTDDNITAMSYCATDDVKDSRTHLSMWANGGIATDIPDPQIIRHEWAVENKIFLIYSIHTAPTRNESVWDTCIASGGYYSGMIIPCRSYANLNDTSGWAEPTGGAVVKAWLEHSKSWLKWWYILLMVIALLVSLTTGLWCWRKKRLTTAAAQKATTPIDSNYFECANSTSTEYASRINPAFATGSNEDQSNIRNAIPILQEHPILTSARIPLEALQFNRVLAKGGYGEVWMGYYQQSPVAIKKLLATKKEFKHVEEFLEEIQLTSSFNHPNIINFIDVAWTKMDDQCMVVEYLDMGDLQTFLKRNNKMLSWSKDNHPIALGIANAVLCLHSRLPTPLIHRDRPRIFC